MDENEFKRSGIAFVSIPEIDVREGCAFLDFDEYCTVGMADAPPCSSIDRFDKSDVIFVEKQQ